MYFIIVEGVLFFLSHFPLTLQHHVAILGWCKEFSQYLLVFLHPFYLHISFEDAIFLKYKTFSHQDDMRK